MRRAELQWIVLLLIAAAAGAQTVRSVGKQTYVDPYKAASEFIRRPRNLIRSSFRSTARSSTRPISGAESRCWSTGLTTTSKSADPEYLTSGGRRPAERKHKSSAVH